MYLYKAKQTAEAPWHRVEPLWSRIRPLWVHQLSQVTVSEVVVSTVGRKVLLCYVARSEVTDAQEVTSAFDITFLVRAENRQARATQALLGALPTCGNETQKYSCSNYHLNTHLNKPVLCFFLFICSLLAYVVFHYLRIVSMKEWRGKPAQVELDVSFSSFYITLICDVHWFSPVSWQGDPHHT